ncbi:MAG: glycosyltransferase family 9 protein [Klebsiella huaxiensis]|uniref:glycosyltransferase family 9 protein n=1 Tax=Klebsiella huaxiensis TaxID=2153354 RepID=UPI0026E9AB3D|nr:glycosyltransferase family 9 protein [Klebsiella huaxiensis]WEJ88167.1 MAG: glycosyltransferase family 9 protein [Klebsiella huaxiensis]
MKSHRQKKFATLRALNRKRNYFFKAIRMELARWIWDRRIKKEFILAKGAKVLLLRDDGKIGDMIVSTSLIRELYKNGYTVDILATVNNIIAIEHNPYIRKIHIYDQQGNAPGLANESYDLVIDMGDKISPTSLRFLLKINTRNVIGFNKEKYNVYNKSIKFSGFQEHITTRYALLMSELGLSHVNTSYDLFYPEETDIDVSYSLKKLPHSKNIIINPFAADSKRELSLNQLQQLFHEIKYHIPGYNIIYLDPNNKISTDLPEGIYKNPFPSLFSAMSLIKHAELVISPDTSIVHIAAAYRKPLIALYGNDMHGKYQNNKTWGPGYPEAVQILTQDKYHPISTIDVKEIIESAQYLMTR